MRLTTILSIVHHQCAEQQVVKSFIMRWLEKFPWVKSGSFRACGQGNLWLGHCLSLPFFKSLI